MGVNKTIKSLVISLPMLALAACSSSDDAADQNAADQAVNNEQQAAQQAEDAVRAQAAKKAEEIKELKAKELAALRREHIVYFDFDKSRIDSQFASVLDAHATYLNANSNVNVVIEGHADERGTPEYNIALGERRAKAVETYLENMGVSSSQLTVVSYGEEKPMAKDRSQSAFAKNRRAVLVY